jgi:hypothetical protein
MTKKTTNELTEDQLAVLNKSYPVTEGSTRVSLPRFGMLSKDITEESGTGKNKKITVIEAAGTFFTEADQGEVNEAGKKVWTKTFLGEEIEVIIAFHRKQLRLFDNSLNKFISSPVYDSNDQIIPLFLDKRVIARGTPEQLRALYPKMTEKGKKSSKLNEETILYILYKGEMFQWNLTISSGWSFSDYKKKVNPSTVITQLSSIEETNGSNTYRKATFTNKRLINGADEFEMVSSAQTNLKEAVESDKQYLLSQATKAVDNGADLDKAQAELLASASKALD